MSMSLTTTGISSGETMRTNNAIYGLIFVISVMVGRIQEIIPGFEALKLGKVAFGLTLILYCASSFKNDLRVQIIPQMKYFFAIFLLGFVSSLLGLWPSHSLEFMFTGVLYSLMLLFFTVKIINTPADLNKVAWSIVFFLSLLGGRALLSGADRVKAGSTYDPNDLAFVLVLFLPLAFFMMKNKRLLSRLILMTVIFVFMVTIMATGSRGGFLGMVVVFIGIYVKERLSLTNIIVCSGILLIAFMIFAPAGYNDRISSIFKPEEDYNRTAAGGRIEIWKRGIQLSLENPLLGIGPNNFSTGLGKYSSEQTGTVGVWLTAHNSFIQISTECGIPALVLLVMILYSSIRSLRRSLRTLPADHELRWLINALEVSFYGYIVCGFFLSQAYSSALFLLVGLTIAITNQVKQISEDSYESLLLQHVRNVQIKAEKR